MNNKGFTLIEVLTVLVIISLLTFFVISQIGSTMSITKEETYKIMKENIISAGEDFIKECNSQIIECNLTWTNSQTTFSASILESYGYYEDLSSPIDEKYLGECLIITATKENGNFNLNLTDNCY